MVEESAWNRSAIDITELGLRSKHPVLFAQLQAMETPSLIKIFSAFAGKILHYLWDVGCVNSKLTELIKILILNVIESVNKLTNKLTN